MSFGAFGRELKETLLSLAPAIGLILFFQVAFVRMPLAEFIPVVVGLICTVFGFVLFIQGAKIGLLPLGQGSGAPFRLPPHRPHRYGATRDLTDTRHVEPDAAVDSNVLVVLRLEVTGAPFVSRALERRS
ncbi:hypothetical protein BH23DEI1_BH23DEI1_16630 [soil metagenome]|nr:DUF1538 family protein [Trueperaceae bacterium]